MYLASGTLRDLFRAGGVSCCAGRFVEIVFMDDDRLNFCDGCRSAAFALLGETLLLLLLSFSLFGDEYAFGCGTVGAAAVFV